MAKQTDLVLLVAPYANARKALVAMTLGGMCERAGADFDLYYCADHKEGGLFAPHGSGVIGGQHAVRIARALAAYRTTVVRLDRVAVFDSLLRQGARRIIDGRASLLALYQRAARALKLKNPAPPEILIAEDGIVPLPALWPECVSRGAWALPVDTAARDIAALRKAGARKAFAFVRAATDLSAWSDAGFEIERLAEADAADPVLALAEKWIGWAQAVDTLEPITAEYMLPFCMREKRLFLSYGSRAEGEQRRDQMLRLTAGKQQQVAYGRWYGDPQLIPLAQRPMAYNVVEPCRHILSVFARHPVPLPQPAQSCFDLEPSDAELRQWAAEGKILASWVLHSGELSHDDAVLTFQDWCAMTKQRLGSGVHWQRYYFDPDAVEAMHVPVEEGGVLGLVEPVLHSTGAGIIWETAGDAKKIVALMTDSRRRIAEVAGERFAPRGVYCFGDHHGRVDDSTPGPAQFDFWKAVRDAGFEYLITSVCDGRSRVLFRDGDFVVLSQAGWLCNGSPFYRGFPGSFAAEEKRFAEAGRPGWMVGAIDSPVHGSPIYLGRPRNAGHKDERPRLHEFYDYTQNGGATGKVISATPRTVARYARLCEELGKA